METSQDKIQMSESDLIRLNHCYVELGGNIIIDIPEDQGFTIKNGLTAIIGESGSGKSTLIRTIMGLEKDLSGGIEINESIRNTPPSALARFALFAAFIPHKEGRIDCSYIEQKPLFNGSQSVLDSMRQKQVILTGSPLPETYLREHAEHYGVSNLLYSNDERSIQSFSGGERQRLAALEKLVMQSPVVFADEPAASVDPSMKNEIFERYKVISGRDSNTGVIMVTHSHELAEKHADTIIEMSPQGKKITVTTK